MFTGRPQALPETRPLHLRKRSFCCATLFPDRAATASVRPPRQGAAHTMSKLEANLAKADKYLARFRDGCVPNQIGGEAVAALDGATFDTLSPVDLQPLAKVAHGKAAD